LEALSRIGRELIGKAQLMDSPSVEHRSGQHRNPGLWRRAARCLQRALEST
jgi:hypothetical protein